ncbi:MAG: substrate-binding domain-containing protein [Acidobacteriia bacterium]|nr:substrate-binding domain-containing protein [Terriglobia bacterium]
MLTRRFWMTAMGTALAVPATHGQKSEGERKSIDIQRAREKRVKARGEKVHYTTKFNLDRLPEYKPQQQVSGKIRIWGLNYLTDGNLAKYWEEAFCKFHPGVKIEWFTPTALVAVAGLYTGQADLGASRHITFDELLTFQRIFGCNPVEISMVTGSYDVPGWAPGTTIVVNKENPLTKINFNQLDGIFGAERGGGWKGTAWDDSVARGPERNIRTWGRLGLTGDWVDKPINVYGRPLRYHQQLQIERVVFRGGDKWNERLREYAHDESPTGAMSLSTQSLLEDLSKDRYGMAYSNLGYPAAAKVKPVAVAEKHEGPYVEMTIETLQDRTYPLFNEEYFYVNRKPGQPVEPKVSEFLRYVLSRQGQEQVMRDGKFLPLTAQATHEQLRKLS